MVPFHTTISSGSNLEKNIGTVNGESFGQLANKHMAGYTPKRWRLDSLLMRKLGDWWDGMEWTFAFGVLDFASEDEADAFESKVTSRCLKASGHNPPENVTYETPSDYDPLAVNMGALTVYR